MKLRWLHGADGVADDGAGEHDAGVRQREMGGRDVAAGHQQVGDVPRVEAAVGDRVGEAVVLVAARDADGGAAVEEAVGVVVVHRPAAVGHAVGEELLRDDVVLGEHVVADEASVLALAGHVAHPGELEACGAALVLGAVVLGVVPDAVDESEQVVADLLGVGVGVARAAELDVPLVAHGDAPWDVGVAAGREVAALREPRDPGRRLVGVRLPRIARIVFQAVAHGVLAGLLGRPGLVVHGLRLFAVAVLRARGHPDDRVAGAVAEHLAGEAEPLSRADVDGEDGADGVLGLHLDAGGVGVEVKIEAGLLCDEA